MNAPRDSLHIILPPDTDWNQAAKELQASQSFAIFWSPLFCSIQTLKMILTEPLKSPWNVKFGILILLQIPKLKSRAKMESWPHWSFFNFQFILCTKVEEVKPPWQSNRVSKLANNAHWRPFTTNCNLCRQRWKDQQWFQIDQAGIPWCCTWTA